MVEQTDPNYLKGQFKMVEVLVSILSNWVMGSTCIVSLQNLKVKFHPWVRFARNV
jgi:hypothetical protein